MQALKQRVDAVDALFLLFPTIAHIANTPNGRRLAVSAQLIPRLLFAEACSPHSLCLRPLDLDLYRGYLRCHI